MTEPVFHVVLYRPEIPPNTGNAGRLCSAIGARLHVVHPLGFSIDARQVRRAGLDYWKHVDLLEHADDRSFWRWAQGRRVSCLSTRGPRPFTEAEFQRGDVLVFGSETRGLPAEVVEREACFHIPITGPVRSLNLANAVAVVAYQALSSVRPELFGAAS